MGLIPRPQFKDKGSYVESSTKQYDQLAFKYLSWVLFPLLAMYAIYSLIYLQHKGWYSWVLNMIYSFLLTFGKFDLSYLFLCTLIKYKYNFSKTKIKEHFYYLTYLFGSLTNVLE